MIRHWSFLIWQSHLLSIDSLIIVDDYAIVKRFVKNFIGNLRYKHNLTRCCIEYDRSLDEDIMLI